MPLARSFRQILPALSIAALGIALMGAVAQREALVRVLPDAAPVFAAVGLPVNLRGLTFRNVASTVFADSAHPVLAVTGEITNLRDVVRPVPEIRIAVRGTDGREMYSWTAPATKAELKAGETIAFRTRLATPPAGAHDIVVRFAETAATGSARPVTARP
jgi:hypothetical protein